MSTSQGTLNHLRAEAKSLPPATMAGEWTFSGGGVRFQVVAGHDERGRPALAWRAVGPELFFNPILTS